MLFSLLACTENFDEVKGQPYSKEALSLTIPDSWKFVSDRNDKGNRTISIETGETSGVTIILFSETDVEYKNLNRTSYVNKNLIDRLIFGLDKADFAKIHKPINSPFTGENVRIIYTSPQKMGIEVESYLLTFDKAKIIVMLDTELNDLPNVENKISGFLKTIEYNS